ncbi:MAG: DNA polymerase III subunit beta [Geminicoccaceae bacterium]|nr:DNA polymerase III subunit beta [Geminicoccaceae bacterium]MCX7628918.1 DNA polymerase III subunit beta [Geminicoccaceae bacterium]MDW8125753.1 DNA polymerase III subunit beta [Geminicoccaceae bacterium]MDW8340344.1 DNA polymerase III subunit beta [Geminicoccaceae bacterium]
MKLTIARTALLHSLSHVQNVVERRTTIPILGNVKLAATDGALELLATDLDLTLLARESAEIERSGATTAPAHMLFDIVRKLPEDQDVRLAHKPGASELEIEAGRSRFALPTLPVEDFPVAADEELDVRFAIQPEELAKLIEKSRFAISTEETRYYLNGVHFHVTGAGAARTLRAVATDGHRLALVEMPCPPGAERMPPVIVPRKTVGELLKLLERAEGPVEVGVSAARIRFALGNAVLVSRLIDGTFPDYERVIPRDNERIAVLATRPFEQAVDRVATISMEKARPVKLAFEPGKLTLSAVSPEFGRAVEELDCDYAGAPLEIGFNARYVLDITGEIEGSELKIEMANAAAPTLFRDVSDPSLLFVLMPMRV